MAARRGTKTAKILALLRRPAGASLPELRKATGWQPHSVRGLLSGAVKKKMGLHILGGHPKPAIGGHLKGSSAILVESRRRFRTLADER